MGYAYEQMLVRSVEEAIARAEAAEARVEVLEKALRAIDRKNDNPACFNADINDIVMAAFGANHD